MSTDIPSRGLSYEDSKALAADDDPKVRISLAARSDLEPEVSYFLAQDEAVEVRRAVAANPSAPHQTVDLLARDEDEGVREDLVAKIAALTPRLDKDVDEKLRNSTHDALSVLAMDQIVHVRETMAAVFKDMDGVPVDVVRTLAVDSAVSVSSPILQHSPILTDDVLLEIIEKGTGSDNLCAISRRASVSESVSGAVVDTNDATAIGELLGNPSAQIQEEVLDELIDRAVDFDIWHEPLVNRPVLPPNAPQKLAQFIAAQLFDTLKSRKDMDEKTLVEVEDLVRDRLEEESETPSDIGLFDYLKGPVPMDLANRLQNSSGLRESIISSALQSGDHRFVLSALISLSGLREDVVKRIFSERSPKGIVSLVWKSGLTASLIATLQQRMARIPQEDVLEPESGKFAKDAVLFPLPEKEMDWNIQFYTDLMDRGRRS